MLNDFYHDDLSLVTLYLAIALKIIMKNSSIQLLCLLFILLTTISCSDSSDIDDAPCTYTPSLTTNEASEITDISVFFSGTITAPTCENTVTSQGFVYAETTLPKTDDNVIEVNGESISSELLNLKQYTKYYYRTFFINPTGEYYGNQVEFTTSIGEVGVTTNEIEDVSYYSAKSGGTITNNGGAKITTRGLCWNTSPNPTINDYKTEDGSSTGSYESYLNNLEENTTYYVRAYSTNEVTTTYGNEETFTTLTSIYQSGWTIYNPANSDLTFSEINDIEFDSKGNKWIASGLGSNGAGITKFDDSNWTIFNTSNSSIVSNKVTDITIDNSDVKWIGTLQDGLMKFDDVIWINYTTENSSLPNNNINCIASDNDNNIWIGTPSGLTKFDGTNWTTYNTTNSNIPDNFVKAIAFDSNNHKWLITGEWDSSLTEFNNNTWIIHENSPTNRLRDQLIIDTNDTKWMGADLGLMSYDDDNNWDLTNYDYSGENNCLLDCQTESLALDLNNNLWVGSFQECSNGNGGLLNFSNCDAYQTSNSYIPDNNILAINIDVNGTIWIGTYNGGLAKLEN